MRYYCPNCWQDFWNENFKKEVFNVSKGNPKMIKQLCFLARDSRYQKENVFDVRLMDLDRRISEVVPE